MDPGVQGPLGPWAIAQQAGLHSKWINPSNAKSDELVEHPPHLSQILLRLGIGYFNHPCLGILPTDGRQTSKVGQDFNRRWGKGCSGSWSSPRTLKAKDNSPWPSSSTIWEERLRDEEDNRNSSLLNLVSLGRRHTSVPGRREQYSADSKGILNEALTVLVLCGTRRRRDRIPLPKMPPQMVRPRRQATDLGKGFLQSFS